MDSAETSLQSPSKQDDDFSDFVKESLSTLRTEMDAMTKKAEQEVECANKAVDNEDVKKQVQEQLTTQLEEFKKQVKVEVQDASENQASIAEVQARVEEI